jgi:hypothetical protein
MSSSGLSLTFRRNFPPAAGAFTAGKEPSGLVSPGSRFKAPGKRQKRIPSSSVSKPYHRLSRTIPSIEPFGKRVFRPYQDSGILSGRLFHVNRPLEPSLSRLRPCRRPVPVVGQSPSGVPGQAVRNQMADSPAQRRHKESSVLPGRSGIRAVRNVQNRYPETRRPLIRPCPVHVPFLSRSCPVLVRRLSIPEPSCVSRLFDSGMTAVTGIAL